MSFGLGCVKHMGVSLGAISMELGIFGHGRIYLVLIYHKFYKL